MAQGQLDTTGRVARVARAKVVGVADVAVHADMGGRRGVGVGAFVLALVTAGAMAHVGVRMKGIEVAYDLGRERHINTQLEEERRRLNIEIGMLKDPVRVVGIARDKLKMGPPASTDIVRLAPGETLGARLDPPPSPVGKNEKASVKPASKSPSKPSTQSPAKSAGQLTKPSVKAVPTNAHAMAPKAPPSPSDEAEARSAGERDGEPSQGEPAREGDE